MEGFINLFLRISIIWLMFIFTILIPFIIVLREEHIKVNFEEKHTKENTCKYYYYLLYY